MVGFIHYLENFWSTLIAHFNGDVRMQKKSGLTWVQENKQHVVGRECLTN